MNNNIVSTGNYYINHASTSFEAIERKTEKVFNTLFKRDIKKGIKENRKNFILAVDNKTKNLLFNRLINYNNIVLK